MIELYGTALNDPEHLDDVHCFVTSDYLDFSTPNGDGREPHPDLAAFFNPDRSGYFYGVEGLDSALVHHLGGVFNDEAEETESLQEEPRTLAEIVAAEREFFDKVWYVRKLILKEEIKAGVEAPMPPELEERMEAAMRAIEDRYGPDNVGPWNDWGWGFVHGKLSALRWVLGSDWDILDT
jgi:hypothetical protein